MEKGTRGRETGKERQCKGANVQRWKSGEAGVGCQVTGDGEDKRQETRGKRREARGGRKVQRWKCGKVGGEAGVIFVSLFGR